MIETIDDQDLVARATSTKARDTIRLARQIQAHCFAELAAKPGQIGARDLALIATAAKIADALIDAHVGPAR